MNGTNPLGRLRQARRSAAALHRERMRDVPLHVWPTTNLSGGGHFGGALWEHQDGRRRVSIDYAPLYRGTADRQIRAYVEDQSAGSLPIDDPGIRVVEAVALHEAHHALSFPQDLETGQKLHIIAARALHAQGAFTYQRAGYLANLLADIFDNLACSRGDAEGIRLQQGQALFWYDQSARPVTLPGAVAGVGRDLLRWGDYRPRPFPELYALFVAVNLDLLGAASSFALLEIGLDLPNRSAAWNADRQAAVAAVARLPDLTPATCLEICPLLAEIFARYFGPDDEALPALMGSDWPDLHPTIDTVLEEEEEHDPEDAPAEILDPETGELRGVEQLRGTDSHLHQLYLKYTQRHKLNAVEATSLVDPGQRAEVLVPFQLDEDLLAAIDLKPVPVDHILVCVDGSASMGSGVEDIESPLLTDYHCGSTSMVPWGDQSRYHFSLIFLYALADWAARQDPAPVLHLGVVCGNPLRAGAFSPGDFLAHGSPTLFAGLREGSRLTGSILADWTPAAGGVLVVILSDGDLVGHESVVSFFEERAPRVIPFMLNVIHQGHLARAFEASRFADNAVHFTNPEQLPSMALTAVARQFSHSRT